MKKCTRKGHKVYLQTKRSELFIGDLNLLPLTKLKITLLLWSCEIFFTKLDESNMKPLIFVGHLCLIPSCNTNPAHCILGNLEKNPRGRVSLHNNSKIYIYKSRTRLVHSEKNNSCRFTI